MKSVLLFASATMLLATAAPASAMEYSYRRVPGGIVIDAQGDIEFDEWSHFRAWLSHVVPSLAILTSKR
jgi:hypothetical protein